MNANAHSVRSTQRVAAIALPIVMLAATAQGQVADPEASRVFGELIAAYRALPALAVKSTLEIELREGELTSTTSEISAELTYSRGADGAIGADAWGLVRLRGMICRFKDGEFSAVHAGTGDAYYREAYEGSPYWPLLINFQDIPYPHIAVLWGETAPDEVAMQLVPETPGIVPTGLESVEIEGKERSQLTFTGPNGTLLIVIDPKTKLIDSMVHEVTGGLTVQPGTSKRTTYRIEHQAESKPRPASEFVLDPGDRQRVDLLGALVPAPAAPGGGAGGAGALVGSPAPPIVLATADGGAVDLAELRGRVVVLDFWATWCGPCRRALPELHDVAAWVRQEELPVTILTINVWENRPPGDGSPDARLASVRAFWKKSGYSLPVAMDFTDETAKAYGVRGIPSTFVIRSDGVVHAQPPPSGEALKDSIRAALEALEVPAGNVR